MLKERVNKVRITKRNRNRKTEKNVKKRKSYYYRTPSDKLESLERPFEFDNAPSWAFKMFPRKLNAFDALVSRFSLSPNKFENEKRLSIIYKIK